MDKGYTAQEPRGYNLDVRTSRAYYLTGTLAGALLAGCLVPALGPTRVLLMVGYRSYMYEGAAVQLSNISDAAAVGMTVRVVNLTTLASRERLVTVTRPEPLSLQLDAATVPDLASGAGLVPVELTASVTGTLPTPGTVQRARFQVVRDRDARLPPNYGATASLASPEPDHAGMWAKTADAAPMEDAALAAAYAWGGRNLAVSRKQATQEQIANLPGAASYVPPVDIYLFEVTGTFPKWVVPAAFSVTGADAVGTPRAIRLFLPQIRQPVPFKIEVVL